MPVSFCIASIDLVYILAIETGCLSWLKKYSSENSARSQLSFYIWWQSKNTKWQLCNDTIESNRIRCSFHLCDVTVEESFEPISEVIPLLHVEFWDLFEPDTATVWPFRAFLKSLFSPFVFLLAIENSYVFNAILWLDAQKILVKIILEKKRTKFDLLQVIFF